MKIYVTKYALTKRGILEFDTEKHSMSIKPDTTFVHWVDQETHQPCHAQFLNEFVHDTWCKACAHANSLREHKIIALNQQLTKLQHLVWRESA